jgi:hypothetical protein
MCLPPVDCWPWALWVRHFALLHPQHSEALGAFKARASCKACTRGRCIEPHH